MSLSPNKKNKYELKVEKENYLRHILRLQKYKEGRSPDELIRETDEKRIKKNMRKLRQSHQKSRQYEIKKSLHWEKQFKKRKFTEIKSVMKNQLNRTPLSIPPKHKVCLAPLMKQNQKIFIRLNNVKSNFNFHSDNQTFRIHPNNLYNADFEEIYKHSRLNQEKSIEFVVKVGKCKKTIKAVVDLHLKDFIKFKKEQNNFFHFVVKIGNSSAKTPLSLLGGSQNVQLKLKIPQKRRESNIEILAAKVVDNKELVVGKIVFNLPELVDKENNLSKQANECVFFVQKNIYSIKQKIQGRTVIKVKLIGFQTANQSLNISRQNSSIQL